jgi:hypothetical protein
MILSGNRKKLKESLSQARQSRRDLTTKLGLGFHCGQTILGIKAVEVGLPWATSKGFRKSMTQRRCLNLILSY